MTIKFHISIIIAVFGLLFLPNNAFACGIKSEKTCCKTETTSKSEEKDCCGNSKSDKEDKSCGGKCGHSNCTTAASISYSILTNHEIEFINNNYNISIEKQKFYSRRTFISSGFISIWLPPVLC